MFNGAAAVQADRPVIFAVAIARGLASDWLESMYLVLRTMDLPIDRNWKPVVVGTRVRLLTLSGKWLED